ncbi:MAG: hypothetical protein HC821_05360, partial [Lewinella sp.]|nr:hypothetical protein [Lewinella sp.]
MLFDQKLVTDSEAESHFHLALSKGQRAADIAAWTTGFLYGSSQLLLYFPPLWSLISQWVVSLDSTDFEQILPILRRTL